MSNAINILAPAIPSGAINNQAITAAALGAEVDLGVTTGGMCVHIAATGATAYVIFAPLGSVPTATVLNTFPIPSGTSEKFQVRKGWGMDIIGSGNGNVAWYLFPI
jgi:hypothetical protein